MDKERILKSLAEERERTWNMYQLFKGMPNQQNEEIRYHAMWIQTDRIWCWLETGEWNGDAGLHADKLPASFSVFRPLRTEK